MIFHDCGNPEYSIVVGGLQHTERNQKQLIYLKYMTQKQTISG